MKYIFAIVFLFGFIRELFSFGHLASNKNVLPVKREELIIPLAGAALMAVCSVVMATQNFI
jgi:hypothetical protein